MPLVVAAARFNLMNQKLLAWLATLFWLVLSFLFLFFGA